MTDRELLRKCLDAFEAIPVAAKARKLLKALDAKPAAYAGNGSHILCSTMAKIIAVHLGDDL